MSTTSIQARVILPTGMYFLFQQVVKVALSALTTMPVQHERQHSKPFRSTHTMENFEEQLTNNAHASDVSVQFFFIYKVQQKEIVWCNNQNWISQAHIKHSLTPLCLHWPTLLIRKTAFHHRQVIASGMLIYWKKRKNMEQVCDASSQVWWNGWSKTFERYFIICW